MTSNVGTRDVKAGGKIGFSTLRGKEDYENLKSTIEESVKRLFNPEFINRIDDFIIFHQLMKEHIYGIIDIQMSHLLKRIKNNKMKFELSQAAKDFIVEKGYDIKFGARPLRRALQKYIEDELAEVLIREKLGVGAELFGDYDDENKKLKFTFVPGTSQIDEKEIAKKMLPVTVEDSILTLDEDTISNN